MDRLTTRPRGRCIVVHSNRLVSEDLRQLLLSEGAQEVVLVTRLEDVTAQPDAIAFLEANAATLDQLAQVQSWIRLGTPVVAMDGEPALARTDAHIYTLAQPFRSEDVVEILHKASVF